MGDEQRIGHEELLAAAREGFEAGTDFTVAVEEEFALLDPATFGLVNRFEEVQAAARGTALEPNLVGELIASEVEVKTGRCETFADVPAALADEVARDAIATPATGSPSTLTDRRAGRPLEVDARNGAVVRLGARHGVTTPVNARAAELMARAHLAPGDLLPALAESL